MEFNLVKNLVVISVIGFIGYRLLYKKYKEMDETVSDTVNKIDLGVQEAVEFLKLKNQELEEKIKERKGKL